MSKYSQQFKLDAVNAYLSGNVSYQVVASRLDIDNGMLRHWVAAYRLHGASSLMKKTYCYHTPEFKLSVLQRMWQDELSCRQTTALFGLRHTGQVGIWERQYYSGGIEALSSRKKASPAHMPKPTSKPAGAPLNDDSRSREQLLAELEYLRMENAYLKKLDALIQSDELAARAKKRK